MLSEEDDVDIHALKRRGMTISEIARRTNHSRVTVRAYLTGQRAPGKRTSAAPDLFDPFVAYVTARLAEDPHLWSRTLFDELQPLGFRQSYPTLTRQIRDRGLRPTCSACSHVTARPNAVIVHPPGEETQFDWLELPDAPAGWGFPTSRAFLLVGSLPYSGKWRGALSPSMDTPHLLAAMTTVVTLLGGVSKQWRFDRMRTVLDHSTGKVTSSFAAFAKHYGVQVEVCRPRSGNRKGVVEKNNHTAAQRWWRTLPDELTLEQAQASLNVFAASQDQRSREGEAGTTTSAAMFAAERLAPVPPVAFPVVVVEERTATRQALIDWRGNRYSVPPELAAGNVAVRHRIGTDMIEITTPAGTVIARHRLAEPGLGVTIRDTGHVTALETIAMAAAPPGRPHRRKERIPPGVAARDAAARLRGEPDTSTASTVISLAAYEAAAKNRNTLQ